MTVCSSPPKLHNFTRVTFRHWGTDAQLQVSEWVWLSVPAYPSDITLWGSLSDAETQLGERVCAVTVVWCATPLKCRGQRERSPETYSAGMSTDPESRLLDACKLGAGIEAVHKIVWDEYFNSPYQRCNWQPWYVTECSSPPKLHNFTRLTFRHWGTAAQLHRASITGSAGPILDKSVFSTLELSK